MHDWINSENFTFLWRGTLSQTRVEAPFWSSHARESYLWVSSLGKASWKANFTSDCVRLVLKLRSSRDKTSKHAPPMSLSKPLKPWRTEIKRDSQLPAEWSPEKKQPRDLFLYSQFWFSQWWCMPGNERHFRMYMLVCSRRAKYLTHSFN